MEEGTMTISELRESGVFQDPNFCEEILRNLLDKNKRFRYCIEKMENELQELRREKANWHVQKPTYCTENDNLREQVESLKTDLQTVYGRIEDLERSVQSKTQLKRLPTGILKEPIYEDNYIKLIGDNTHIHLVEAPVGRNRNDPLYQEVDIYSQNSAEATSIASDASIPPPSRGRTPKRRRSLSAPLPPLPSEGELQTPVGDLTSTTSTNSSLYSRVQRCKQPAPTRPPVHTNLATDDRSNSSESDEPQEDHFSFSLEASSPKNVHSAPPANVSGSQVFLPMSQHKNDKGAKRGKKTGVFKAKFGQHL